MNRIDTYARDIRNSFAWGRIKAEAQETGYCLLGSVFSLTPSGKFYAPFACSNVMGCARCKGTGKVKNRRADAAKYAAADARNAELLADLLANHGPYAARGWPTDKAEALEASRKEAAQYQPTLTCTWCDGMGSHEAAMDNDWQIALEQVAEKHGLYVYGPEGSDGCDVWVSDPRSPVFAELNEE